MGAVSRAEPAPTSWKHPLQCPCRRVSGRPTMSSVTSLRTPGSRPQNIAVGRAETNRQLTDSTRLMCSADTAAFTAWCASVGRRPLPASAETIAKYVANLTVS